MNKILKNIILTIVTITIFIFSLIVMFFASYGISEAILSFPKICDIETPAFCIGTLWYNQLYILYDIFAYIPIFITFVTFICIIKIWKLDNLIYKLTKLYIKMLKNKYVH